MSNLETVDLSELVDRYNYLIKIYVPLAAEIAPKIEKFGKLRQELQIISAEFVKRGYDVQDPESLKKILESEIEKRNVVSKADSNKRDTES